MTLTTSHQTQQRTTNPGCWKRSLARCLGAASDIILMWSCNQILSQYSQISSMILDCVRRAKEWMKDIGKHAIKTKIQTCSTRIPKKMICPSHHPQVFSLACSSCQVIVCSLLSSKSLPKYDWIVCHYNELYSKPCRQWCVFLGKRTFNNKILSQAKNLHLTKTQQFLPLSNTLRNQINMAWQEWWVSVKQLCLYATRTPSKCQWTIQ
jgi:hypothetical protein